MEKTTKKVRPKSVAARPKKEAAATRKSTFAIIFVLQKGKAREDGTAPIVARITVNHEMVHFATRMYIHPDRWLPKDYRTVGKSREEKQINDALDELRVLIRRRYDQMLRGEETITAAMLKNAITGLDQSTSTLLGVCDRFIEDYTDLLRTKQCCRETYLRYLLTRNRLEEFMRNRYRIPDIPVKEIQPRFAAEFDRWLRITYQLTNNSTMKLMRQLKTMLRVGHLNGWSKNDPLAGYKIHFEKVDRGYLTDAELSRLESKVFTTRRLEVIRDLFLFSCYTGLAYIDLKNLTSDMLQRWPDGNLWIPVGPKQGRTMKLLNGFFFVEAATTDDEGTCYRLRLDPQHVIFRAHFPGNPITPGVCIVQLVTELLEWMTGRRLELRRVVNVKFLHVLSPAERTSVQVLFRSVDFDGAQCRVKAVLKDGGLQLAQLSLICDDVTEE